MKKGDIVKIYKDPGTCKNLEGEAKLLRNFDDDIFLDNPLEHWWVKFVDDGFETNRLVNRITN